MKLNKQTLSEQIYQILRKDILTRVYPPGKKLTLKQLQERFGVSSTPIREALTRLSEDGLTEYYSNIGINVIHLKEKDLRELYEFMADLDSLAILHAASHPDQSGLLDRLSENIREFQQKLSTPSPSYEDQAALKDLSDNFHLLFYDYCGNSRMCQAAGRQRSQLTMYSNQYSSDLKILKAIEREHLDIWKAYSSGDPRQASRLMHTHLLHSLSYALKIADL